MGLHCGMCGNSGRSRLEDLLVFQKSVNSNKMTREQAKAIIDAHGITDKVVILGYRSASSKYGEYDDMGALYTPDIYIEFNFNTLPTKWEGQIAKLMPGVYRYKKGLHGMHHLNLAQRADGSYVVPNDKRAYDWLIGNVGKDHPDEKYHLTYWAFRQAGPVTVIRHGANSTETKTNPAEFPFIDIHKGGNYATSSEGCQTVLASLWAAVRAQGYAAMDKYGQKEILYCLVQL
jgi:hypothetical protein